jgi:hypothetical protein
VAAWRIVGHSAIVTVYDYTNGVAIGVNALWVRYGACAAIHKPVTFAGERHRCTLTLLAYVQHDNQ